jgi:2-methylcitrate dehydratase
VSIPLDKLQKRLTDYARELTYETLPPDAVHAAKVRVIDTLGALVGGFFAEPCQIARNIAVQVQSTSGATIIGTRIETSLDMAAFVNGITQRYGEFTDVYHWPGNTAMGHPSDMITPILSVADNVHASGRDYITSVVLAYEAYMRISDAFRNMGFDHTTFCCLGIAMAAGRLMKLTPDQMAHCISMAVVPNNALRRSRVGAHLSMWKVGATGKAAQSGVFAAIMARAGMEGAYLPFEGKSGWFDHVALECITLDTMGGAGTPFKIGDASIKLRPAGGFAISPALAAERIAPLRDPRAVKKIVVETHERTMDRWSAREHWNPQSREAADHSLPFIVSVTLIDGRLTLRSLNDAHLRDPGVRELMSKLEMVENKEFTRVYNGTPQQHRIRITVTLENGEQLVGEAGSGAEEMSPNKTNAQNEEKFRGLMEDYFSTRQVDGLLKDLWKLEDMPDVAAIPPRFAFAD